MKKYLFIVLACFILAPLIIGANSCFSTTPPTSLGGATMQVVKVEMDSAGRTVEQENVKRRIEQDNKIGAIKHLYIISAYSGQVVFYSTVQGKVTSGNKRLTPSTISGSLFSGSKGYGGFVVDFPGDNDYFTQEVLGEDGTYGSSGEYIFWWDTKGVYHQHYMTGGQIVHISSQPITTKSIVMNVENTADNY